MAMPTSGSIGIKTCPGGVACTSIDTAVTSCSSGSLSALSVAASKGAPHCMREFYGYSSTICVCWCTPDAFDSLSVICSQRRIGTGIWTTYSGTYGATLNPACRTGIRTYFCAPIGGSGALCAVVIGGSTFCTEPGGGGPGTILITMDAIRCAANRCFDGQVSE